MCERKYSVLSVISLTIMLIGVMFICINMTDGARRTSSSLEPTYAPLEEKAGRFDAVVYDEKVSIELRDFSFFGHTTVGGLKKEDSDASCNLDLANVKEVIVKDQNYVSTRYKDQAFCFVDVVSKNGNIDKGFLIPKHVIICGINKKTNSEMAWFLSKVDRVVILQPGEGSAAPEKVIGKIYKETKKRGTVGVPEGLRRRAR
jgi:hypothetical protein